TAARILAGMAGQSFISLPGEIAYHFKIPGDHLGPILLPGQGMKLAELVAAILMLAISYIVAFALPNTAQLFCLKDEVFPPAARDLLAPAINWRGAIAMGLAFWIAAFGVIGSAPSEFIYFQF